MYQDVITLIRNADGYSFEDMSAKLEEHIRSGSKEDFLDILREIGTIPECIGHDSTEEKLFSKASDAVLSRALCEIGLKSTVLRERGDSADVLAESFIHGYTLVADAKSFRLSRTAKNQKDFKVTALSRWKKGSDYALLCAPYFQYPRTASQIYAQSLDDQVVLISWEHLLFLIEHNIRETECLNFSELWNFPDLYSQKILYSRRKHCLLEPFSRAMAEFAGLDPDLFSGTLKERVTEMSQRAKREIAFWEDEIRKIESYSREEAIRELIQSKKISQKICQIDTWTRRLQSEWTNSF